VVTLSSSCSSSSFFDVTSLIVSYKDSLSLSPLFLLTCLYMAVYMVIHDYFYTYHFDLWAQKKFWFFFSLWNKVKLYQDGFFLMENLQLKQWPEAWFIYIYIILNFFFPRPLFFPPQLCDVANFWLLSTWGCSQIWLKTRYESRKV